MAQLLELGALTPAADHRECQRRPVEAGDRDERISQIKGPGDVSAHLRGSGGRERGHRRSPARQDSRCQKTVVRPEVVSPGGDAVRFVDDHPADSKLGQPLHETRTSKSLGREEQEPVLARDCLTQSVDLLRTIQRRVDERGGDAVPGQAVNLILHQRDERRDDHRQPAIDHSRDPVADALAGSGGRDGKNIASLERRGYDLSLPGTEGVEAKDLAQDPLGRGDHQGSLTVMCGSRQRS